MNNKYVIIFCLIFVIEVFSNISFGNEIIKVNATDNFLIGIISLDKTVPSNYVSAYPIVEILYPQDGAYIPSNYLEVLGYAMDPDGMNYMEWTYQYGDYVYHDNETFNFAQFVNFRVQVYNILPGTHTVTVIFYDIYNNTGSDSVTVHYGENHAPEKPNKPEGSNSGTVGIGYSYSTNSTDVDSDKIKYGWDWDGDNTVDEWTGFYPSGEVIVLTHIWSLPATYNVKVLAEDEKGSRSGFSSYLAVVITENNPPNKPSKPTGSIYGNVGVSYSYESVVVDNDSDQVYYLFDWGDGTDSGWIGSYYSGDSCQVSHIWNTRGSYPVKVKAKDVHDAESVWSDSLTITIPKIHNFNQIIQLRFKMLDRFPFFEKILKQ